MPQICFDLSFLAHIEAKLSNIVGEHVKFEMCANSVAQFGHTFSEDRLGAPENRGTWKIYQRKKGTWLKLRGNKENLGLSRENFHLQILKYFSILTYRVLNSGLHDSIKLDSKINSSFSVQKLLVNIISSYMAKERSQALLCLHFPTTSFV